MRNLVQYPVTKSEIVECLRRESEAAMKHAADTGLMGDMRAYLLRKAADVIASLPEDEVNEKVRVRAGKSGKPGDEATGLLSFGS